MKKIFTENKKMFITAWKVSKCGIISDPYFPVSGLNTERYYLSVFSPNTGKYRPEITPYLDTFHAVHAIRCSLNAMRCDAIKKISTEWDAIFTEIMQCANSVKFWLRMFQKVLSFKEKFKNRTSKILNVFALA